MTLSKVEACSSWAGRRISRTTLSRHQLRCIHEFSSLTCTLEASKPLACIIGVELPRKRLSKHVSGAAMPMQHESRMQNSSQSAQVSRPTMRYCHSCISDHTSNNHINQSPSTPQGCGRSQYRLYLCRSTMGLRISALRSCCYNWW